FFFQAEDGIRDFHVTGVQTCALPIFAIDALAIALASWLLFAITRALGADHAGFAALVAISGGAIVLASSWSALAAGRTLGARVRSEERRVGKECRRRRRPAQWKYG